MAEADFDAEVEQADAGASATYPLQASALRKGGYVMVKGHPCKVVNMSTSKTGKHGHAKINLTAQDIFTGKKYEDIVPSTHSVDVPNVKKTEYSLVSIDEEGYCGLMLDNGEVREDLKLPEGELGEQIQASYEKCMDANMDCMVTTQKALDLECIVSFKEGPAAK